MWYCAHAILYWNYVGECKPDDDVLIWEHLYLIEADDAADAHVKAQRRAIEDESTDDSFTLNDRPARLKFAGVRKVVECQNTYVTHDDPIDGTELSYNTLTVKNLDDLKLLFAGEPVQVEYLD